MVEIYNDYSDEPKDSFQPLSDQLSCKFYNMEMDSFSDDISFYRNLLPPTGPILELGCGSGRVIDNLATKKRPLTGIDLCLHSLHRAKKTSHPYTSYVCMDMTQLGFIKHFVAVIVPYNTLNLLTSRERIIRCLLSCKKVMQSAGQFLSQIYIPAQDILSSRKKQFQFQIFERSGRGRIIKEMIKKYDPSQQTIEIEERYRVRPMQPTLPNKDYNRVYSIAAFTTSEWIELFTQTGFEVMNIHNDYEQPSTKATEPTCLFVHLRL